MFLSAERNVFAIWPFRRVGLRFAWFRLKIYMPLPSAERRVFVFKFLRFTFYFKIYILLFSLSFFFLICCLSCFVIYIVFFYSHCLCVFFLFSLFSCLFSFCCFLLLLWPSWVESKQQIKQGRIRKKKEKTSRINKQKIIKMIKNNKERF